MDVSSCSSKIYDVFLSFRGRDVRKSFADCLYRGLKDAGISVFRDEEALPVGEPIDPKLVQAIQQSKMSMPIFSRDYASSKSCLMEVQQMMECQGKGDHKILPIFFDVEPSVVKHQNDTFKISFTEHEQNGVDPETISMWKYALEKIGHLKGWDLQNFENGYHSKAIQGIISAVRGILKKPELRLPENLVGLDHNVEEVMRRLDVASNDVRIIVIHGIGGVGKTTLAKAVYNQLCHRFEACGHVDNIREASKEISGLRRLQRQLVSELLNKKLKFNSLDEGVRFMRERFSKTKVLILLDDLDNRKQLEFLGELNHYGPGSTIIVTTRKGDILKAVENYEVECMNGDQALQLFCKHAFHMDTPQVGYYNLSREIVAAVKALPLALEVIGCRLFTKAMDIWEGTLEKLKLIPDAEVKEKLMISYESLDESEREVFLDIACFFIGKDQRIARYMWDKHKSIAIETLISRSLAKIGDNGVLWMHDLLRDLGREIVRNESPDEPGKRSRLWNHDDAISTLQNREGTRKVIGLGLAFNDESKSFSPGDFNPLSNLRFLKLDQANIQGDFRNCLPTLRWLDWAGCSKMADLLNLHLDDVVILNLSYSQITRDIYSWTEIMKSTRKLKVLDLKACVNLSGCIEFPASMTLKVLTLEDCRRLRQIDPSIRYLKELESLNLKMCCEVANLPSELSFMTCLKELLIDGTSVSKLHFPNGSMKQLKTLSARGCKRLRETTDSIGGLKSLSHLALDDAIIEKLPRSIGELAKLESLSLRNCQNLLELPDSLGGLESLSDIDLTNTRIDELPLSFKDLTKLQALKMEGCFLREFPDAIADLPNLKEVNFSFCRSLTGEISNGISTTLRILRLSHTKICGLPATVRGRLANLQILDLRECKKLQALPDLPSSLVALYAGSNELKVVPNLSNLVNLKELHLRLDATGYSSRLPQDFEWVSRLPKLEALQLSFTNHFELRLPGNFAGLSRLRKLTLIYVDLQHLPQLPSRLSRLSLQNCRSSSNSPDLSNMHGLLELELEHCEMANICGLHRLEALQVLRVSYCTVKTLEALEGLRHLRDLTIFHCSSLANLPDLSHFEMLQEKDIEYWNR
ncbi:TMV resistance protein N-like [Punica granatum]|uniref:TMV resistance protein N-like n=1 Tax=Punica granatum TaxID=22663 RepID=A0A6P8CV62_PUNGR|nr:TMV resistance protein N-like [Punica granatum]XP_031387830.1 TMV resistance protein N-like [Punica granatum]XP_031387831.1 TMV resistance protein N-like [Punica granatum]XP_031387832.1 TMV resistance protein N-like [Punica granatum]XP_031387834.1 TMV resistance protein N-like [Punica granatum]XP_031387835.1 TMV resistance protein N-like [Punica granatum]XP_031387836.1 TMV resistance protein N-like [Punica granatum]XP_031387837.1 TMV resistance protein N-like [Punica granatum]XP_03138783